MRNDSFVTQNYQYGIVISCSNDTTIKLWSLQGIDPLKGQVQTVRALSTLNEDFDYVRAIAYSPVKSVLYSAADNGIVRVWDINSGVNKQVRIS
jgi:WD40 repeat protein